MITASASQRFPYGPTARGAAVVLVALAVVGCKSGSSWTAKPSWWTFGGTGDDPAALASAPTPPTDVTKPSAAAKPYPTTTTPEGYVVENAQRAGQSQVATTSPQPQPPAESAAVTYGTKPPAPVEPPAAAPQIAASSAATGGLSSITPQVGPYGSVPGAAAPADQSLPSSSGGFASAAPAAMPAAASAFGAGLQSEGAATRVADARGAESWGTAAASPPSAAGDSRYGGTGSRFAGGAVAAPAAAASFAAPPIEPPPAAPAAMPAAMPAIGPTATPSSLAPPTPTRRPDPGYRPGGTSSYRPSRTILAGETGSEPGGIQPVSFQAAVPANAAMPALQ